MKRKWISVLLLLALTLALLPTVVLAEGETELTQVNIASNMKLATGSYKLMKDISLGGILNIGTVYAPATVTLDLNGHTLTGPADLYYTLWINQYSELTIIDSSPRGSGKVEDKAVMIDANASFTLKSGEISNGVAVGRNAQSYSSTTFTMDGGRVTGGVNVIENSIMELNNGTVDGIQLADLCTLYANGGTVTGPCTFYGTVRQKENTAGTVFNGVVVNATGKEIPGTLNGGTVTGDGFFSPFLISNAAGLKWFRDYVNSASSANAHNKVCAKLMNDIDLKNEEWTPIGIGKESNQILPYSGTFDGNGYTISGLNVTGDSQNAGLFGVVTGGTIKDLTVAGSVSSRNEYGKVGGIVGYADGSTIENCGNLCTVNGCSAGGIAGQTYSTTISACYNAGKITGDDHGGGIAGYFAGEGNIYDCYNVGTIRSNVYVGGIVGTAQNLFSLYNCYNAGTVTGGGIGDSVMSTSSYYLKGSAIDSYATEKSAEEFADGTVLKLLKNGTRTGKDPWDEKCRLVPGIEKYLPVFKYQDSYEAAPESASSGSRFSYATISASAGENGKVSPSGDLSVRSDLGQTFTFTPDKGYRVADVLVNGKSVGALRSYTFATARSDQTLEVVFEKIPAFSDVPAGSYYEEAVNWALENWIAEGTSDGCFSPDAPCTRAQAVTLLWRAAGCPSPSSYKMPFADVKSDSYYYQAVLWAIENGIAQGTSETAFEPDVVCTRAQIVCFLFRFKAANGMDAVTLAELLGGYADSAEIPAYARPALNWAISANVLQGSGNKLLPNDACTRAQIVTLLYRAMR